MLARCLLAAHAHREGSPSEDAEAGAMIAGEAMLAVTFLVEGLAKGGKGK